MPSKSYEIEPAEVSKGKDRAENWYKSYGGKISRGFIQKFGRALTRNELLTYLALSTYHNPAPKDPFDVVKTGCCWPKVKELQEASSLTRTKVYQALRGLIRNHGLIERWALYLKRGRRRRIKFFRLLYVSSEGLHVKDKQQLTARELSEIPDEQLPPEYAWRQKAQPIRARDAAGEGEGFMYAQDETCELVPRGKRKRKRKTPKKLGEPQSRSEFESNNNGRKKGIRPELRDAIRRMYDWPDR